MKRKTHWNSLHAVCSIRLMFDVCYVISSVVCAYFDYSFHWLQLRYHWNKYSTERWKYKYFSAIDDSARSTSMEKRTFIQHNSRHVQRFVYPFDCVLTRQSNSKHKFSVEFSTNTFPFHLNITSAATRNFPQILTFSKSFRKILRIHQFEVCVFAFAKTFDFNTTICLLRMDLFLSATENHSQFSKERLSNAQLKNDDLSCS